MTPSTTPDARALFDQAVQLPPDQREKLAHDLLDTLDPIPGPPPVGDAAYWKAEIARRIEAIRNGTMKMYTIEETMAHLQTVVDEGKSP